MKKYILVSLVLISLSACHSSTSSIVSSKDSTKVTTVDSIKKDSTVVDSLKK